MRSKDLPLPPTGRLHGRSRECARAGTYPSRGSDKAPERLRAERGWVESHYNFIRILSKIRP